MKLWLELFCWSQSWATGSATVHMGVGVFKASSGSCPKALLAVLSLQVGSARFSLDPLPCTWFSAPVAFILGPDQLRWNPSKARYAEEMQPRSLQRSQHWLGRWAGMLGSAQVSRRRLWAAGMQDMEQGTPVSRDGIGAPPLGTAPLGQGGCSS